MMNTEPVPAIAPRVQYRVPQRLEPIVAASIRVGNRAKSLLLRRNSSDSVPKHIDQFEAMREDVDALWSAYVRLHRSRDELSVRERRTLAAMKPPVQALVWQVGLAFQCLEERWDDLAGPRYLTLVEEVVVACHRIDRLYRELSADA